MSLPEGHLLRSRVVEDPAVALSGALEAALTGYAVLEPQNTLLLDAEDAGVVRFRSGVPVAAFHAGTDRGGPPALADLAVPGPYSVELHAVDPDRLGTPEGGRRIPPGMAAERLAGDPELARRTRDVAAERGGFAGEDLTPDDRNDSDASSGRDPAVRREASDGRRPEVERDASGADAVRAFLDDEEKIAAIKAQAREQARDRAAEWGIEDQLRGPEG